MHSTPEVSTARARSARAHAAACVVAAVALLVATTTATAASPAAPLGIQRVVGRRPVMAFGNSDRERAYDRDAPVGRLGSALDTARAKGWTVIDMKRDRARVFAFDS